MPFGAYAALLACALLVDQLWWGGFAVWQPHAAVVLAALWCLARPGSLKRFLVLTVTAVGVLALDMPQVGDHLLLVLVTGLAVLGWVAAARGRGRRLEATALWAALAPFLRAQVVLLYAAASLAKLNTGFLDPAVSCAAAMSRRIAWLDPSWLDGAWRELLPIYGTLAIEACLPVLLLVRRTRPAGLALGAAFHVLLALAGNAPFSALVLALYVAFLPETTPARLRALAASRPRIGDAARGVARVARSPLALPGAVAVWLAGAASGLGPGAYGGAVGVGTRIVVVGAILVAAATLLAAWATTRGAASGPRPAPARARLHPAFAVGLLALALNAASPYLGLKTEASFAMFSDLQTEPGHWNHLLLPERLRIFDTQDDLVRIVKSSDPRLERRVHDKTLMVRFELERYLRANPRASAWVVSATAPPHTAPDGPLQAAGLPSAGLRNHVMNYYDVHPRARGRC